MPLVLATLPSAAAITPLIPTPTHTPSLPPTSTPITRPTATPTLAPPPRLVASHPIAGDQAMPTNRPLTLVFDQPMDRASVEIGLVFSPTVAGRCEWPASDCVIFRPTAGWPPGSCELTLNAVTSSAAGTPLEQPLRLTFANGGKGTPVPILMYHHILELADDATKGQRAWTVSPRAFEEQMTWLVERGWHSINPAQLAAYWRDGSPLPSKPIVISMDDGYKEVYTTAAPIFTETSLRPTLFITPRYIGYGAYMTWEQLGELATVGYAIGAHGYDHSNLRGMNDAELALQIGDSRQILKERLSVAVDSFCYPYGGYDDRVLAALEKHGYTTAVTLNPGYWQSPDQPYQLDRLRIDYSMTLTEFAELLP